MIETILPYRGKDHLKPSDAKQRELTESFDKYEDAVIGKGKHEELHKQLTAAPVRFTNNKNTKGE